MIDLPTKYREIIRQQKDAAPHHDNSESVSLLFKTDWVRILVVQSADNTDVVSIEIEMSMFDSSLSPSSSSPLPKPEKNASTILEQLIEHIHYLLRLESLGFTLELVSTGCLLLAYRDFSEDPSDETFKLLLPPSFSQECV